MTARPKRSTLRFSLALAQVIVGRTWLRPRGRAVGIEAFLGGDDDATVLAHLDNLETVGRVLIHPMLSFQLGDDAFYRALDAERLAAANAAERLLLLEHARRSNRRAEVEPWHEGDHFFRTGRLAQAALHAGIFSKTQQRPLGVIRQCAGGAGRDAG